MSDKPAAHRKVDRKFLLRLANRIFNPKTKQYLRLCKGTLENGPDPETGRTTHCGIGELAYSMYGKQPKKLFDDLESFRVILDLCKDAAISALPDADYTTQHTFAMLLHRAAVENDDARYAYTRAKRVADIFRKAADFLKEHA